jgi:methylmalonyl-CoA mutase N-terminal domain/subunit
MGGTQSLHTNAYDEALGLPTEEAATIALRTQQILAYESGATDTADPFAGSYYIEHLTHEMEQQAMELIGKVDALGGSPAAIESGFMQEEIARSAYAYQKSIEEGRRIIVGLNKYQSAQGDEIPILKVDDQIRREQMEKLASFKKNRDNSISSKSLESLSQKATAGENIMPAVIESVENNATLGEIAHTLRKIYGEFR